MSRARSLLRLALFASALAAGCGRPHRVAPAPAEAPVAVVVSWDGAKASAVTDLLAERRLPVLAKMAEEGVWTLRARTIAPSLTLPSHVSMLTGVGPERHTVTFNRYRPEFGPLPVPTLFEVAEGAGVRTALVCGKEKFRHLQKPGAPSDFLLVEGDAEAAAREAVALLRSGRPGLLFLHLGAPDAAGHESGWGNEAEGIPPSPELLAALVACDRATGLVRAELEGEGRWARALLLVTADHGGHGDTHGSASDEDSLIPWFASGGLVTARGELEGPVRTLDTSPTALAALGVGLPAEWRPPQPLQPLRQSKRAA